MSETPDYAALARAYLDLWEDQLAALASDPALSDQTARFFETMGQAGPLANPMATAQIAALAQQFMTLAGMPAGGKADDVNSATAPPARSATAAAPFDDGAEQLDELLRRLAAIEERLDRLEAGGRDAGGGAAKPARRRASAARKSGSRTPPKPNKRK